MCSRHVTHSMNDCPAKNVLVTTLIILFLTNRYVIDILESIDRSNIWAVNLDFCFSTISNDVHRCLSNDAISDQQCSALDGSFINHNAAQPGRGETQSSIRSTAPM